METDPTSYGLAAVPRAGTIPAPALVYQPREPESYSSGIAIVGCGGISEQHCVAYQKAGYPVRVLCDRHLERAQRRQRECFPDAIATDRFEDVLANREVGVVDLTPHPRDRLPLMEAAILAGKHVLSQKPFVLDLDDGERLVAQAERRGVRVAVNQNARFAPHFRYLTLALEAGLVGDLHAVHCGVHWNHHWIVGTPFEAIDDLVLFDFGIHWFDLLAGWFAGRGKGQVYATSCPSRSQTARPPLLAQAMVRYPDAQASLVFDADTRFGPWDRTMIVGSRGTLCSEGPDLQEQRVTLTVEAGVSSPELTGHWFPDGFHGAMAELLCAIAEDREPLHSARSNLASLELCFAAVASARQGQPVEVGAIRAVTG